MKQFLLTFVGILCSLVTMAAADYSITVTRTVSQDCKTSKWDAITINKGSAIQGKTAEGDGIFVDAIGKVTCGGAQGNYKADAIVYLEVPSATAAGSIELGNGSATDRYFQTESGTQIMTKGTDSKKNFTSSDIVTLNGKTYLKLTSKSDCKLNSFQIVLTSGTYASLNKLTAPTISNTTAGSVTITGTNVYYTTDGSTPTSSSTKYSNTFDVQDGTVVKAICIGDGTTTANSDVVSKTVLVDGVTVATPTITAINGTVKISCATACATIKYSTDGSSYSDYTGVFTLTSDKTVYAKAVRENCTDSEVASQAVSTVSKGEANESITLYYDGEKVSKPEYSTLTFGDWKLELLNKDKDWTQGANDNATVTVNGDAKNAIKVSNGAQNRIVVPEGIKVTRLTFYSVVNGTPASNVLWGEVNGTRYTDATQIPMENTLGSTPDVRVFGLDEAEGNITFTNAGVQLCFAVVIDYIAAPVDALSYEVNSVDAEYGKGTTLPVLANPAGLEVEYESSNPEIASVDASGIVTINENYALGTTIITAKATEDNKASYTLNVFSYEKSYSWKSGEEVGGTAKIYNGSSEASSQNRANYTHNAGNNVSYKTISLNGNIDYSGDYARIILDKAVNAGDKIYVTAYIDKGSGGSIQNITQNVKVRFGSKIEQGTKAFNNLFSDDKTSSLLPNTDVITVPEGVSNCSNIDFARYSSNTGLFITEVVVVSQKTEGAPTEVVVVNSTGISSFCSDVALDFTNVEGIEAYAVTEIGATSVKLTKVTKVAAGEGIFVKGTTANVPYATEAVEKNAGNLLVGTTKPKAVTASDNIYALSASDGKVHPVTSGIIVKGKAYLVIEGSAASKGALSLSFGGGATASEVQVAETVRANGKYTENGQIVIFINGKKYNVAGMNK